MKIGAREVGPGHPCYIIAEAGTGHFAPGEIERLDKALDLVDAAADAGADAVKFQLFVPDEPLFCPVDGDEKRWKRWSWTLLPFNEWVQVKLLCEERGIDFLASAFQPSAVEWLKMLKVPAYKVASRAAASYPYESVPGPFLISTGAKDWAMGRFPLRSDRMMLLHCVAEYPVPLGRARYPECYEDDGGAVGGLSDHSGTVWPGLDAMARGCPLLEVHFTLDRREAGPDASVCLTTDQLKLLCEARDGFAALRQN